MKYLLERLETSPQGTFGRLFTPWTDYYTGELQDLGNKPQMSCIPDGEYKCFWTYSPAFKRHMYLVANVPGRAGIRIHSANYVGRQDLGFRQQLQGCISLGFQMGTMDGQKCILRSRFAVLEFEDKLARKEFLLEIRSKYK